jgi:hypothetical protein
MRKSLVLAIAIAALALTPLAAQAQQNDEVAAEIAANLADTANAQAPAAEWKAAEPIGEMKTHATVFFSDFEADNGGGVGTLDWEWGTYAWVGGGGCNSTTYPPAAPYSGTNMWATVLNGCYNGLGNNTGYSSTGACDNTAPADDSILTFTVDLTGLSEAWLYWWEWYDVYSYWDWADVWVNGNVVFQHCESSYTAPTQWVQQEVDISAYVGGVATIEFHMMASSVVNYSGWYIDDFLISDVQIPVELQSFSIE